MLKFLIYWLGLSLALLTTKANILGVDKQVDAFIESFYKNDTSQLDSEAILLLDHLGVSSADACSNYHLFATGVYPEKPNLLEYSALKYAQQVRHDIHDAESPLRESETKRLHIMFSFNHNTCTRDILEPLNAVYSFKLTEALYWPNWTLALEQDEWEQREFDWVRQLGLFRQYGLNGVFFKEHVTLAYNDASKLILELSIPDKFLDLDFQVNALKKHFERHIDVKTPEFEKFLPALREFNKLVANIGQMHANNYEKVIYTLAELQEKIPDFDWKKYLSASFERTFDDDSFQIQLNNPSYIRDIVTLIDQTAEKELSFYILIRYLYFYRNTRPFRYEEQCDTELLTKLPFVSNFYHNFIFRDEAENQDDLQQIFTTIKAQFLKKLQKNKYQLDETTLENLKRKINEMTLRIGTTPINNDSKFYLDFYKELNDVSDAHEFWKLDGSVHLTNKFLVKKQHDLLFKSPADWELNYFYAFDDSIPQQFEPFYVPQLNVIVVPQTFLMPPVYSQHLHKIFQYATAGFAISRAFMSAFSPENIFNEGGAMYDYKIFGNEAYKNDISCFHNAAYDYTAERIPDITGFQLMLDAFYHDIPNTPQEAGIHFEHVEVGGKQYNMKEVFFRYFAQYFAGKNLRDTNLEERLNAIVDHAPQFSTLFKCTAPKNVCSMW